MRQRFIVPQMLMLFVLAATMQSYADTPRSEEIPNENGESRCFVAPIELPLFRDNASLTIATCRIDCEYALTVHLREPLGSYTLRTYQDIPLEHTGWHLVVNNTFVTVLRHQRGPSCTP